MLSAMTVFDRTDHPSRHVRLDTLLRLRWFAVIGQTIAVLIVQFVLEFPLPIRGCLAVIALSTWLNVILKLRFSTAQRLDPDRAAWLLAFDIGELAVLLFLTGGLQNPFSFLFLAPVLFSATALPPRFTLALGGFAMACATVLLFFYYPLPWDPDLPLELPPIYTMGVWLSILLAIGFIGVHAWQITEEGRKLTDALAATELTLAQAQHLSQLDGLAAAAAHELGTPLSTITLVSKELERALADTRHAGDVKLLRDQAQRCRDILAKLAQLPSEGAPFDYTRISALIEEVVSPHRDFGVTIDVRLTDDGDEPVGARNAAVLYGLGNLVENAVDFARENVDIVAKWDVDDVAVTIGDDGPGFAADVLARLGEPYVTTRRRSASDGNLGGGLGLGFFIAKTLLERSGAVVSFGNRPVPARGALVTVRWRRADFEHLPALAGPEPEFRVPSGFA